MDKGMKIAVMLLLGLSLTTLSMVVGSPSAAADKEVYKFKFVTHEISGQWSWPFYVAFKDEVEKRSGGRIALEVYPGQSLVTLIAAGQAIAKGVADMGCMCANYEPARYPLESVFSLPPLYKTSAEGAQWWWKLRDEYFKPFYDKGNVRLYGVWTMPPYWIFSKGKPANRLEDLKGWTLRAFDETTKAINSALGTVPTLVAFTETFDGLQKGIIDATPGGFAQVVAQKWYETGKPGYMIDLGGVTSAANSFAINKTLYEKLPQDLQTIIDEAGYRNLLEGYCKGSDDESTRSAEVMRKFGNKIIVWSDAEKERYRKLVAPLWDAWAKDKDSKGLPGSKLVTDLRALAAKAGK